MGHKRPLCIDTSVLSAFARAQRLGALEAMTKRYARFAPQEVRQELERGFSKNELLADVAASGWLGFVTLESPAELQAFAKYASLLGAGERNLGESAVLAWSEVHAAIALIDDREAVNIGREQKLKVGGTLGLLAAEVRSGKWTLADASELCDVLVKHGGARFPCTRFDEWARAHHLI